MSRDKSNYTKWLVIIEQSLRKRRGDGKISQVDYERGVEAIKILKALMFIM